MAPHLASMNENLDLIPRIRKQEKQKIMGRKEKKEEEEKQELKRRRWEKGKRRERSKGRSRALLKSYHQGLQYSLRVEGTSLCPPSEATALALTQLQQKTKGKEPLSGYWLSSNKRQ